MVREIVAAFQTKLFKQNFMSFGWIAYAFKCYQHNQQTVGIPLGNGAYIPYGDEEQRELEPRQRLRFTLEVVTSPLKCGVITGGSPLMEWSARNSWISSSSL